MHLRAPEGRTHRRVGLRRPPLDGARRLADGTRAAGRGAGSGGRGLVPRLASIAAPGGGRGDGRIHVFLRAVVRRRLAQ
ncbi:MAG: hypothetical protein AVDCRST_MAG08-1785 [uncultured Acetobacteraceae bacterium]|uniref:Uncharacterized protein n=1 Tax=uncultured Acetobacteraceae bacterium TaxID=169975 RepID=A0A6J4I8B2_9PROT|nr:MAG: hypothetical protein AVDCRST_MAG08-1785 [uncultured Acetobacteraceae bacterium]